MTKINLPEIRNKTVPVDYYIESLDQPFREEFLKRKQTYQLDQQAVEQLKTIAKDHVIIAFSAGWCKDCAKNIPVLALISEATGLEVRVFGGIKKDPLSHTRKWRIPPSPPEVELFNVYNIPLMIIAHVEGYEVGRIVENPKTMPTLEQEICEICRQTACFYALNHLKIK